MYHDTATDINKRDTSYTADDDCYVTPYVHNDSNDDCNNHGLNHGTTPSTSLTNDDNTKVFIGAASLRHCGTYNTVTSLTTGITFNRVLKFGETSHPIASYDLVDLVTRNAMYQYLTTCTTPPTHTLPTCFGITVY